MTNDIPLIIAAVVSVITLIGNIAFNVIKSRIDSQLAENTVQQDFSGNLLQLIQVYRAQIGDQQKQIEMQVTRDQQNDDKITGLQSTVIQLMEQSALERIKFSDIERKLYNCEQQLLLKEVK
jgi:hypothetical protein